jgi:flotillin
MTALIVVVVVVVGLAGLLVYLMWKVAEPDEAMIVSGLAARGGQESGLGFKIVVGKGTLVIPGFQTVRRLSLAAHKSDLTVDCVTTQGIPVHIRGVVIYKVGDGLGEIANATRRFLEKDADMAANVQEVFAGHLRSIVGTLTVEEIIRDREKLALETRNSSVVEMEKLGLVIDSLQIQEVLDPTGYIENVAKPFQAAVEAAARIAAAERNQEATQREQAAAATAAKAVSESEIEQAKLRGAADRAKAEASQAGPFVDAQAHKAVVIEETAVAELEAARTEKRLQTEIVKPAEADRDAVIANAEGEKREVELRAAATAAKVKIEAEANAEQRRVLAEADAIAIERTGQAEGRSTELRGEGDASAIRAKGLAEAEAIKAKGLAEADAIKARAQALEENHQAVINVKIAEQLPEIVRAAAESFKGIDNLYVLNGAEGMNGMLSQVMGAGIAGISMFKDLLASDTPAQETGNGATAPDGSKAVPAPPA